MRVPGQLETSLDIPITEEQGEFALSLPKTYEYVGDGGWSAVRLDDTLRRGTLQLLTDQGKFEVFSTKKIEHVVTKYELVTKVDRVQTPYKETIKVVWNIPLPGIQTVNLLQGKGGLYWYEPNGKKFTGLIARLAYDKPWKLLRYMPAITPGNQFTGDKVVYGVGVATRGGRISMMEMKFPVLNSYKIECYRIVSEVLVNELGEWEKPDGWPDNPTYPEGQTPPDAGVGVLVERVHEICFVTTSVTSIVNNYSISYAKPYAGDPSYTPVKSLKVGDMSNGTTEEQNFGKGLVAIRNGFPL